MSGDREGTRVWTRRGQLRSISLHLGVYAAGSAHTGPRAQRVTKKLSPNGGEKGQFGMRIRGQQRRLRKRRRPRRGKTTRGCLAVRGQVFPEGVAAQSEHTLDHAGLGQAPNRWAIKKGLWFGSLCLPCCLWDPQKGGETNKQNSEMN